MDDAGSLVSGERRGIGATRLKLLFLLLARGCTCDLFGETVGFGFEGIVYSADSELAL